MKKLFILALLFSTNAWAFDGLVTDTHDGDTLTVTNELGFGEKIRLAKVDTPELKAHALVLNSNARINSFFMVVFFHFENLLSSTRR